MRTTVRIDDDILSHLKAYARRENMSLGRMLNRVLRAGLATTQQVQDQPPYTQQTFAMGTPREGLHRALAPAAALEDDEIRRKLTQRK